jgi:hypothetical protein
VVTTWQPFNLSRSRRLARRGGRLAVVNGGGQPVLGCGSQFSRGLQRPAKKRVLRFFAQGDKAITIAAIELDTIANSAGLLAKHARTCGAADSYLVFQGGGSSNEEIALHAASYEMVTVNSPMTITYECEAVRTSKLFWAGLTLLALGTMPLLVVILFSRDPNRTNRLWSAGPRAFA